MNTQLETGQKTTVHHVLAYSYATYFFAILAGLFLHFFYPIQILNNTAIPIFGFILLILGTYLIYWAQSTSRRTKKEREVPEKISHAVFKQGPYTFSSSPTHLGLTLLSFGFALVVNSFMLVATTLAAYIITKLVFVKKEEEMLAEKYGEHYKTYKKSLR